MEIFLQDFRYALRVLRKNPGFTIVAILTLAFGIGANTAIFSITNGLFLRPLPVPHPDQMVRIIPEVDGSDVQTVSHPTYTELRNRIQNLEITAHQHASVSFGARSGASTIHAEVVTGNYFRIYGLNAAIGRTLSEQDDQSIGGHSVAVISYRLWNNSFQLNPTVLGQKIYLNGHPFSVVGVLPKTFQGSYLTSDTDVWTPMTMHEQVRPRGIPLNSPGWGWLSLTGRLRDGSTLQKAQTEMDPVSRQLQKDFPKTNGGTTFRIIQASALPESLSTGLAKALGFLTIVAALVLMVVCANLAGALLPHVLARRRETAIRNSLGASQARLLRQWLTETVTLAFLGGVTGLLFSIWCKEGLKLLLPEEWQSLMPALSIDLRVLIFAFIVSLITGIFCGMLPAMQMRKPDLTAALKGSSGGTPRHRIFGSFVAAQTSISLLLLIVAALLLRSLVTSSQFSIGFDSKNLLLLTVDTQRHGMTDQQGRDFFDRLTDRLKELKGIESLSYATVTPLGTGRESQGFEIPGYRSEKGNRFFSFGYNSVGPDYFQTMRIPVLQGRGFKKEEVRSGLPSAVVINQTMAKKYWPSGNAIGQRIRLADGPELEIVGVAKDIQYYSIGEEPQSYIYSTPNAIFIGQMTFQIRTTGDPEGLTKAILREIATVDPNVAPYDVMPFSRLRRMQMFPLRALTMISILIGTLALILTSLGIYGVLSYSVTQRTKEIGLRMALGASRRSILRHILRQGVTFVLIGTAIGLIASLFATQFLSSILFQVSPTDEISFLAVTILLTVVAILASWIPARKAMKIEPTIALRYE